MNLAEIKNEISFALVPKEENGYLVPTVWNQPKEENGLRTNSCDLCGKQFSSYANLYTHKMSAHKGVHYPCEKCPYKATTKGNLKGHVESVHENIRHVCSVCDSSFTSKKLVKIHVKRVHTGMYI